MGGGGGGVFKYMTFMVPLLPWPYKGFISKHLFYFSRSCLRFIYLNVTVLLHRLFVYLNLCFVVCKFLSFRWGI